MENQYVMSYMQREMHDIDTVAVLFQHSLYRPKRAMQDEMTVMATKISSVSPFAFSFSYCNEMVYVYYRTGGVRK